MASALLTVSGFQNGPTVEQVAEKLGVPISALDREYGIVLIDRAKGVYAVLVEAGAVDQANIANRNDIQGPYANPHIGSFR